MLPKKYEERRSSSTDGYADPGSTSERKVYALLCFYGATLKGRELQCPLRPLEPLTSSELHAAVQLLKAMPIFSPETRIISVALKEPGKALVYRHTGADGPGREGLRSSSTMEETPGLPCP